MTPVCFLILWLPTSGLLGSSHEEAGSESGRTRSPSKLESLSSELSDFDNRYHPEVFCPEHWREIESRFRDLEGEGQTGETQTFRVNVKAFEESFDEIQSTCLQLARTQTFARIEELSGKVDTLKEGLRRGILRETSWVSDLLSACEAAAQRSEGLLPSQLADAFQHAGRLLDRLAAEAFDPCEEDFRIAQLKQANGRSSDARRLYERIIEGPCLSEDFVEQANWALGRLEADESRSSPERGTLLGDERRPPRRPEVSSAVIEESPVVAENDSRQNADEVAPGSTTQSKPFSKARKPSSGRAENQSFDPPQRFMSPQIPELSMTMWQSAWVDFSNLEKLEAFIARNHLSEVYLNPGLAITGEDDERALDRLKDIVGRLRALGIRKVHFLYAELNYDIGAFAKFLRHHRGTLGIDTLADDSEFTDLFKDRFEQNLRAVTQHGIQYAAFVTLESVGNSGVSDETRLWVLKNVNQPILMSYFGCSVEEQKSLLDYYLSYADALGRLGDVRVAILMGSKKVGREVSCERQLDEESLQEFLQGLHAWAAREHPSYGGIVLENNRPLPRYDVAPRLGR